jgi:hypothetical protein
VRRGIAHRGRLGNPVVASVRKYGADSRSIRSCFVTARAACAPRRSRRPASSRSGCGWGSVLGCGEIETVGLASGRVHRTRSWEPCSPPGRSRERSLRVLRALRRFSTPPLRRLGPTAAVCDLRRRGDSQQRPAGGAAMWLPRNRWQSASLRDLCTGRSIFADSLSRTFLPSIGG